MRPTDISSRLLAFEDALVVAATRACGGTGLPRNTPLNYSALITLTDTMAMAAIPVDREPLIGLVDKLLRLFGEWPWWAGSGIRSAVLWEFAQASGALDDLDSPWLPLLALMQARMFPDINVGTGVLVLRRPLADVESIPMSTVAILAGGAVYSTWEDFAARSRERGEIRL